MSAPRARLVANLVPSQLVEAAIAEDMHRFMLPYGDSPILLIGIPDGDAELENELAASESGAGVLPYRTESLVLRTESSARRGAGRPDEPAQLAALVQRQRHFVLSLRKRSDADALYADRVSVGRARNKDIVLRHSSVSKFHAWFETDADGTTFVADADSKNLTRVNGETLMPRERRSLASGDVVRFGSIDCVICAPSTFWACVHTDARPSLAPGNSLRGR